jgi:hypothetical protein
MFVREERPQSDPGKGFYWTLNVALGEGNKRDGKRKRDRQDIDDSSSRSDVELEQANPQAVPVHTRKCYL